MAQFSLCPPSSSSFLTFSLERGTEMSSSKGQQQQQQHVPLYSLLGSSLVFHNFRQHEKKGGHSISRNRRRLQYKMEREIELVSLLKWLYTLVLLYNRCSGCFIVSFSIHFCCSRNDDDDRDIIETTKFRSPFLYFLLCA